jgi:hypothetical protein
VPDMIAAHLTGTPERDVAHDLVRRGLPLVPVVLLVAALPWGIDGAASAAFAMALVAANFLLAAALLTWAARISLVLLMGMALGGYVLRLSLILVAVLLVRNQGWVEWVPFGITLIVAHLGLLVWELKYVSASLAFPGLKPHKNGR